MLLRYCFKLSSSDILRRIKEYRYPAGVLKRINDCSEFKLIFAKGLTIKLIHRLLSLIIYASKYAYN